MKSSKPRLLVLLLALLVILLGCYFYFTKPIRYDWSVTYDPMSRQPYGTAVFHDLMRKVRSNQEFILLKDTTAKELLIDSDSITDNYVYIGSEFFANLQDTRQIFEFVKAGNKAYIICENPQNYVSDSLLILDWNALAEFENSRTILMPPLDEEDGDLNELNPIVSQTKFGFFQAEEAILNVSAPSYQDKKTMVVYKKYEDTLAYQWSTFSPLMKTVNGANIELLGSYSMGMPNFIKVPYGTGYFYFHSTPIVFTNIAMLDGDRMRYCREVLSEMGTGKVYWDEDNRNWDIAQTNPTESQSDGTGGPERIEGPMEFILSEPSLRWAWYTLLAGGILYLAFGARRKQRVIPVQEELRNTTIEYAEVISQLFMEKRDHKKLIEMKMEMFRSYVRERYLIRWYWSNEEEKLEISKMLVMRSNVSESLVKDIIHQFITLQPLTVVETQEMIKFHLTLETFYQNSK